MNEIPFADSNENFRVGNIYCIGKNYPDHIKEFTDAAQPNEPVVFIIPNQHCANQDAEFQSLLLTKRRFLITFKMKLK